MFFRAIYMVDNLFHFVVLFSFIPFHSFSHFSFSLSFIAFFSQFNLVETEQVVLKVFFFVNYQCYFMIIVVTTLLLNSNF